MNIIFWYKNFIKQDKKLTYINIVKSVNGQKSVQEKTRN